MAIVKGCFVTNKYLGLVAFIKIFILCVLVLKIEVSFADGFLCDASITEKVLERYQNLTSYKDKGALTTNRGGNFTFETIYKKPDELKFIFYSPPGYGAYEKMSFIMFNNAIISIFESERFDTKKWDEASVQSLLQSATGVTSGSSLVIPPLLVGMNTVWSYMSPTKIVLESNKEGVAFCKVLFELKSSAKDTYWVSENGTIERFHTEFNISRHLERDMTYQIIEMK